jgi:hypothetical protein
MNISGNSVVISWEKLLPGKYFSIAYQVFVKENTQGVYPVITNFSDENGLRLIENTGIFVVTEKPSEAAGNTEKTAKLHAIKLEHPSEIIYGQDFLLSVVIQKGKNTGPGRLAMTLPVGCKVDSVMGDNLSFSQIKNEIAMLWEHMPASPVFEVKLLIKTKQAAKAAYPITASFVIDENVVATDESHILIADQKQLYALKQQDAESQFSEGIDTTELFSNLEKLLNNWQESTGSLGKKDTEQNKFSGTDYRIQILASKTMLLNVKKLLLSMDITETFNEHYDGEYYRYTVGMFSTKSDCAEYLKYLHEKGFSDAFVRKYVNGEPATEE